MSGDINFKFFYHNKAKQINFFTFDNFDQLMEWIFESFPLSDDVKIVFIIPSQFKTRENLKIESFFDVPTFKYFKDLVVKIYNKDPNFFKLNHKIEIKNVDEYPEGLPSLKKHIDKTIKNNKIQIEQKLRVELKKEKLDIESYKYNIDKLKKKEFEFACHNNVICNNCFKKNFVGLRFVCSECNNFNLCENCETKLIMSKIQHNPNHLFIQIAKSIEIENNIYEFNNKIQKKNQVINIYKEPDEGKVKVNFIIHNIGEKSFKNCFLYPICYGEQFLFGNIVKIENDVLKGEKISIDIEIENINNISGTYYSKWRMFNKNGIPFGEIIHLTFIILQFKIKN